MTCSIFDIRFVGFRFQTVPNELFSSKSGGESLNIATFFLLYGIMGYFDHQSGDGIFRKRENRSFDPVCSLNPPLYNLQVELPCKITTFSLAPEGDLFVA